MARKKKPTSKKIIAKCAHCETIREIAKAIQHKLYCYDCALVVKKVDPDAYGLKDLDGNPVTFPEPEPEVEEVDKNLLDKFSNVELGKEIETDTEFKFKVGKDKQG